MVKRIASVLSITLFFCSVAVPARGANPSLNIGVFPTEGAAEVYYAQQLGYFKDAGLDVTLTPTHLAALAKAFPPGAAAGARYPEALLAHMDSEKPAKAS